MRRRGSGTVIAVIVYAFEGIDEALDLVPLAGRRALDAAARKVGLEAWRALPLGTRRAIVEAGSAEAVEVARVLDAIATVPHTPLAASPEPSRDVVPAALAALPLARWRALRALDRWALENLARRGREGAVSALRLELGLAAS